MEAESRLAKMVEGLTVTPGLPAGWTASTPEGEAAHGEPEPDRSAGLSYFLRYDGGSLSNRRISVRRLQVSDRKVSHVLAYCHERRAVRLFRADRIAEAIDIETGEVMTSQSLCSALMNRGIPVAEQRLAAMIRILVFMARCDGHAHALEWEEIDKAVVRLSRCLMDDERAIDDLLADARRLAPTSKDFMSALRGLTKTRLPSRMHQELRHAIGAVIEADGEQREVEISWGMEACDFIARMPTSS